MGNMMRLLVLLLSVLFFVKEGFSIKCYECGGFPTNRASNPLCEGEDDFGRDGGQTCQTDRGYSVCIKIEEAAKLGKNECKSTEYDLYQNNSAISVIFCTCETDDCNSGLRESASVFLFVIIAFLTFSFYNP